MSEITRILSRIDQGDPAAAEQLLPLVYDELRKLAAARMRQEKPGQTLQATALVHEAYIRLVDQDAVQHWDSRGHFFAATAEAMRRILVESARRKRRRKRGGDRQQVDLGDVADAVESPVDDLLDLHQALTKLEQDDLLSAKLVKLRNQLDSPAWYVANSIGLSCVRWRRTAIAAMTRPVRSPRMSNITWTAIPSKHARQNSVTASASSLNATKRY